MEALCGLSARSATKKRRVSFRVMGEYLYQAQIPVASSRRDNLKTKPGCFTLEVLDSPLLLFGLILGGVR